MSSSASTYSAGDVERAIVDSAEMLGYYNMKVKQLEAVKALIEGNDTFVSLPTGFGKSLIYAVLPFVFDKLRGKDTI